MIKVKNWITIIQLLFFRFESEGKWSDDLIWCPSQCEKYVKYNGKVYLIYLRWRWSDPWTADLYDQKDNFICELPVKPWRQNELIQLKADAEKQTKLYLLKNK